MPHAPSRLAVTFAALATCAAAQTTHVVGTGGFASIQAALAVAASRDVILVQPGSYPAFHANVGVTIRAVTPGTVFVQNPNIVSCPATEVVHLVDLDLRTLFVNGTTCTLDRCRVTPAAAGGVSLVANSARLHLQQCDVGVAGAPSLGAFFGALDATHSAITAANCSFRGCDGVLASSWPGRAGVRLHQTWFHGSHLTVQGGDGVAGSGTAQPGDAVSAFGGRIWISDSTLQGGTATNLGGPAACPLVATTTGGALSRCVQLPAPCPTALGQNGPGLGVHVAAPLQSGAPFQLDFPTEPGTFVGVFASHGLLTSVLPGFAQHAALDPATLMPLAVLVADPTGRASGTWTLPPGTANLTLWFQAVAAGPSPLQLSPPAGGVVH